MRAIQFAEYGPAENLREVSLPIPDIAPGKVRVRIRAIGVNPADTKWRSGMLESIAPRKLPVVPGYDIAGEIDAVGEGVAGFAPGDRVLGALSPETVGAYAEYAVTDTLFIGKAPANLDFAAAATLPTPGLTAFQFIEEHIRPKAGSLVLVTGAVGAVGRLAVFAAKRMGAKVVAAVRAGHRKEALALGADHVVVLGGEDWSGGPFDSVADTVGGSAAVSLCRHLAAGGTIQTVGFPPLAGAGLPVQPQFVAVHPDSAKLEEIARLLAKGEISMPIARRLKLQDAAEAHRLMEAGGLGGKIVLEV